MTLRALARQALAEADPPRPLVVACLIGILLTALWPTNLAPYRSIGAESTRMTEGTDHYLRHVNTVAQIALPLLHRDAVGVMQLAFVATATTLGTHGLKYLLDPVTISGRRLGERPSGGGNNVPSGHSSLATSALYFVCRRYGWRHALYLLPVALLTMAARVELNAHTLSAVVAGALLGLLMAALFTGRRPGLTPPRAAPAAPRCAA